MSPAEAFAGEDKRLRILTLLPNTTTRASRSAAVDAAGPS